MKNNIIYADFSNKNKNKDPKKNPFEKFLQKLINFFYKGKKTKSNTIPFPKNKKIL